MTVVFLIGHYKGRQCVFNEGNKASKCKERMQTHKFPAQRLWQKNACLEVLAADQAGVDVDGTEGH